MRYGFRVHSLQLAHGLRGRRKLDVLTCTNSHELEQAQKLGEDPPEKTDYFDLLVGTFENLADSADAATDVPALVAATDGSDDFMPGDDAGTPRLTVEEVTTHGRRISVLVEYGHLGFHHIARGAQRDIFSDLTDQSPMQRYRMEFLVPSAGTTGLIASETITGSHALSMTVAWVNHLVRTAMGDDQMVRLMAHPLTDLKTVLALLDNKNALAEVQLKRTKNATSDGVPSSGTITLREEVVQGTKTAALKTLLKKWSDSSFNFGAEEREQQVKALAEIVAPNAGEMGFDDGLIRLEAPGGKKITVKPTRLGDLYAFPIGESRPSSTIWEQRTKEKLEGFATSDELSVAWA